MAELRSFAQLPQFNPAAFPITRSMATSSQPFSFEDIPPELEAAVEAFLTAWNDAELPPAIDEYLDTCDTIHRRLLAIELVKIDIEHRWQLGLRKFIEDYVVEIPELEEELCPQLVLEEFRARRLAGDTVDSQDYVHRFPLLSSALEKLLAVDPLLDIDINRPQIELNPGDQIDDFDLLSNLGQGAFAKVFLARQRSMQRIVAVKISADHGNEPQMLAKLDHANIIRVYDQRQLPERSLRLLYMQYAPGGTLASVLERLEKIPREKWNGAAYLKAVADELDRRGETPPTESAIMSKLAVMTWPQVVCWIGSQLGRALDYAHRLGVLHRDIKPANVLLTAEGVPKLADFNIGFSDQLEGASAAAYFGGSLAYMSPEQLQAVNPRSDKQAQDLDARSDLYSLGILLWELSTGDRPFPESGPNVQPSIESMIAQRESHHRTLASASAQDDIGLRQRLIRCLAADPADRIQTGLELAHELELCLDPDAKALLAPEPGGWKGWVRSGNNPLFVVTMMTLIPNLIGAIFNFLYNRREVIELLPGAEPTFMRIQSIINSIVFPVGILSAVWLAGSVSKATRIGTQHGSRPKISSDELAKQRIYCLKLGHVAVAVGLVLWCIAAPIYPISLRLMVGQIPLELFVHFVASLVICGLIAAAYPFFGVTFIVVRCFYPSMVEWETMSRADRSGLQNLMRQTWVYLILAACVPLISILILVLVDPDRHSALIVLATGGLVGYAIAVTAFRYIQVDLATLLRAIWRADGSSTRSHQ